MHVYICLVTSTCVRLHLNPCVPVDGEWNICAMGLELLHLRLAVCDLSRQRRSLASISPDSCRPSSNPSIARYLTPCWLTHGQKACHPLQHQSYPWSCSHTQDSWHQLLAVVCSHSCCIPALICGVASYLLIQLDSEELSFVLSRRWKERLHRDCCGVRFLQGFPFPERKAAALLWRFFSLTVSRFITLLQMD